MLKMSALKLIMVAILRLTQLTILTYPARGIACFKHHSHKRIWHGTLIYVQATEVY